MHTAYLPFVFLLALVDGQVQGVRLLHIGALFNSSNPLIDHSQEELQAAQLAIAEINQRYEELFDGHYQLALLSNHSKVGTSDRSAVSKVVCSQCDPVYAVDAFFYAIFRRPQLLFLVGTSCSNETKAVIQVADYYNLILVSEPFDLDQSLINIRSMWIAEMNRSIYLLIQSSCLIPPRSSRKRIERIRRSFVSRFPMRITTMHAWLSSSPITGHTWLSSIRTRRIILW
jgi:hypothetical protein